MDKLRSTFPISVEFTDGELPTAAKLNGVSRQAKNSASILERAIGDLWNQAGDDLLTSDGVSANSIAIPNIARMLGRSHLASPMVPYFSTSVSRKYFYKVKSTEVGYNECILTYPAYNNIFATFTWTGTGAPSDRKATVAEVTATGDWYVNLDTGYVYTFDAIQSDWMLEYVPVISGDIDEDATFNIIPDPDQDPTYGFYGVKIEYANLTDNTEGYRIFLPPRGPLTREHAHSPQRESGTPSNSSNYQTSPSSGSLLFWQDDSVAADTSSNAEHYRYLLPKIITDAAGWAQSVDIPYGLCYLYDPNQTGTIIEGVTFAADDQATPRKYVLIAQGTNLDAWLSSYGSSVYTEANMQSSSHVAARYPSNGLRLITVGTSILHAFNALLKQFMNHDHSTSNSLPTKPVSHSALKGLIPFESPLFDPSPIDHDDHPQYLIRNTYSQTRGKHGNMMLGDVVISSSESSNNYDNLTADSYKLRLGGSSGHALYHRYDASSNILALDLASSGGKIFSEAVLKNPTTSRTLTLGLAYSLVPTSQDYAYVANSNGPLLLDGAAGIQLDIGTGKLEYSSVKTSYYVPSYSVIHKTCSYVFNPATQAGFYFTATSQVLVIRITDIPHNAEIEGIYINNQNAAGSLSNGFNYLVQAVRNNSVNVIGAAGGQTVQDITYDAANDSNGSNVWLEIGEPSSSEIGGSSNLFQKGQDEIWIEVEQAGGSSPSDVVYGIALRIKYSELDQFETDTI